MSIKYTVWRNNVSRSRGVSRGAQTEISGLLFHVDSLWGRKNNTF